MKRLVRVYAEKLDQQWYVLICFPGRPAIPKLLKDVTSEEEAADRLDRIVQLLREIDEKEDRRLAQVAERAINAVFAD